jgi:hypothetical protein
MWFPGIPEDFAERLSPSSAVFRIACAAGTSSIGTSKISGHLSKIEAVVEVRVGCLGRILDVKGSWV